eukprot:TRINITY_DN2307_c0_g1_i2.p1 TRINITY_DN2307_c0_g1~~TRINITY_DN2307_c0_g1_i2.p1  ORF type:complete len:201 (-),score=32.47 TRINITY_DN2307_c0_g1_i2:569-1120(-)
MALYGWFLRHGDCIPEDRTRGNLLLQKSKTPMARAWCLLWGVGVPRDHDAAFRVLNTECDASDPHVQYMRGKLHHYGWGCRKSESQAAACYKRAGNHVLALYNLGLLFSNGIGVAVDVEYAVYLYQQAAEQGYSAAQYQIAFECEHGEGLFFGRQLWEAEAWYKCAAAQGHHRAVEALQRRKW